MDTPRSPCGKEDQGHLPPDDLPAPVVLARAFKDWDRWCAEVSRRADLAKATGRPIPKQTARSGEKVTAKLVEAEQALAADLGITASKLHEKLLAGRREGLSFWQVLAELGVTPPPGEPLAVPVRKPARQIARARQALQEGAARQLRGSEADSGG
jgi:hypothetical protein